MPESESRNDILIARLREHLHEERYGRCASRNYPSDARRVLRHLARRGQSIELRGLSASTREHAREEARLLLRWLRDRRTSLALLSVADLDACIAARRTSMRRTSKVTMISTLRGVLRYLYGCGLMPVDFAGAIEGPGV